jgi:hypothetical protein
MDEFAEAAMAELTSAVIMQAERMIIVQVWTRGRT